MSVSDVISSAEGLDRLRVWASDPAMARTLIQDETIMGGLVLALSNPDDKIVEKVLQILIALSGRWDLQAKMRDFIGMEEQLDVLESRDNGKIADYSRRLQHTLYKKQRNDPLHDSTNTKPHQTRDKPERAKKQRRNSFFINSVAKSRMIVLQVRGMNDKYDAETARASLLSVRGVISITFDLRQKRIILRTQPDLMPEMLATAISRTMTMAAQQVVKDDDGNEAFLSFTEAPPEEDEELDGLPDYPEEPSPVRGDKNLAKLGDATPGKDSAGVGFLKSVGSFLTNSFYW